MTILLCTDLMQRFLSEIRNLKKSFHFYTVFNSKEMKKKCFALVYNLGFFDKGKLRDWLVLVVVIGCAPNFHVNFKLIFFTQKISNMLGNTLWGEKFYVLVVLVPTLVLRLKLNLAEYF